MTRNGKHVCEFLGKELEETKNRVKKKKERRSKLKIGKVIEEKYHKKREKMREDNKWE